MTVRPILIVDDDPAVRDVVRQTLTHLLQSDRDQGSQRDGDIGLVDITLGRIARPRVTHGKTEQQR